MKVISIGGSPCTGKTTLGKSLAKHYNAISFDLEYIRTQFFIENPQKNLFFFTNNEPFLAEENYRDYFLRCVIYEHKVTLDNYISWYKVIMNYIDNKSFEIINNFNKYEYEEFIKKYAKVINYFPSTKPNVLIFNHALLPITTLWEKSDKTVMLTGEEKILINRFLNRENLKPNKIIITNIKRHFSLYEILNKNKRAKITIDTSVNFANKNLIKI